jgi:hypothetical protein
MIPVVGQCCADAYRLIGRWVFTSASRKAQSHLDTAVQECVLARLK